MYHVGMVKSLKRRVTAGRLADWPGRVSGATWDLGWLLAAGRWGVAVGGSGPELERSDRHVADAVEASG
jgi:hypothetical protein